MRISDWSSDVCSSDLIQVRLDGAFDEIAKIGETPIVAEGRTLKLSDVAELTRGYEDPATFLVRHQGDPALALGGVKKNSAERRVGNEGARTCRSRASPDTTQKHNNRTQATTKQ